LITGATPGGIGYEAAKVLRDRGYNIVLTARKGEVLDSLKREGFKAFYLDYADSSSIDRLIKESMEIFCGDIYGVFNNGAYGQPGAVEDLSVEVLREQFEANFFGWHYLVRKVLPSMHAKKEGRIIQHSSVLGLTALRYRGAYNASKFALEGLSDTLRLELKGSGVYISTINTGPIESNFRENAKKAFLKNIDIDSSRFADEYKKQLEGRFKEGAKDDSFFTEQPVAVVKKLIRALEDRPPKPRYYVTGATYLMEFFRRVLPTRALDYVSLKIE